MSDNRSGYSDGVLRYPVSVVDHKKTLIDPQLQEIQDVIPEEATPENQLADKNYVNEKVSTDSATFKGTYNLVNDLSLTTAATHSDVATALAGVISTADNNDYCWVEVPVSDTSAEIAKTDRYKFNGTAWAYEFTIGLQPETMPNVRDYTSWDSTGTTQGGAGAMVVVDETGYKAIIAITSLVTVTNMHVGQEMYIPANAVLDGETLITVYDDPALTTDSGIKVKISAERKATLNEALSLVYYSSRDEANQYTDEEVAIESANQKNLAAIVALASDPNAGVTTVTTNPEWKLVYTDADDRILLGKRQDNTWYFAADLDDILDAIIDGYGT